MIFTRAVRKKSGAKVQEAFLNIVNEDNNKIFPERLECDQGSEFKPLRRLLKSEHHMHITLKYGKKKASICERAIQDLKVKMLQQVLIFIFVIKLHF